MAKNYPMATKDKSGGSITEGGKVTDRSGDYGLNADSTAVTCEGGGFADGNTMGTTPDTSPRIKHP